MLREEIEKEIKLLRKWRKEGDQFCGWTLEEAVYWGFAKYNQAIDNVLKVVEKYYGDQYNMKESKLAKKIKELQKIK